MSTLVPPSRLGSSSANAVIDMKSSNVFLSTWSPVVILWGTSFQHSGLLSSELWECENTREATCTTAFLPWPGNPGPEGGSSRGVAVGAGAGSCGWNSISLSHYPVVQKPQSFILRVSTSLYTAKASFLCTLYFLVFFGFSFGFTEHHWTASEKLDQLVEIRASW